jgi:hypothetical protein
VANKILVARGTKARIEEIKSTLATNELVYSTDTGELGVKKANGNIEYFMNATDINAKVDPNAMAYFDYAGSIYGAKYNLLASAWEHSLTVDPLEISVNSTILNPRGGNQYPNGEAEGVIIPQGVTSIGKYAFYGGPSSNQPIVIPNSVTSIGKNAFNSWTKNNHPLVIPSSVTSIGSGAFAFWSANNKPLVIPESVTIIETAAFRYWESNNQPLVIPDSVTSIGDSAFTIWTSNNQPLVIPNSVTSIGDIAFSGWQSNNKPLVIPDSVTSIGVAAFRSWVLVPYVEIQAITPPTLASSDAFDNQNNAPIYVPDESVDAYKTATNWVDLASRIFPISDKADVIGDIKSALDAILGV